MSRFPCYSLAIISVFAPAMMAGESLPHQAYVWQRAWTPPVCEAVAEHGNTFEEAVVLAAEVAWINKAPQVARIGVDFPTLTNLHCPIGLALRVGPAGGLGTNRTMVDFLAGLAASLAAEARKNNVNPVELQIDFDCATAKLDDYRAWLTVVQQRLAPLPVTITVLPDWLDSPAFRPLAAMATNYVLQVHSLEKPASVDAPFSLCDTGAAERAVARAAKLGIPFRVALPTYAYIAAFNTGGKFIGISADGPRPDWPKGTQWRELPADPLAMSALVRFWNTNHPPAMQGVIWFRLPAAADNLNWRWPTLGAIIAGRVPREKFRATTRRAGPGLVEISLENTGELDISSRLAVEVRWTDARLVAGDALRDFELSEQDSAAIFQTKQKKFRLPAGEHQVIGWLRLEKDREVQLEVKKI